MIPINCRDLQVGDQIIRMLAGVVPMPLKVSGVDGDFLHCGPWKFHRDTGGEVDEDLGWDGVTYTGSFIKRENSG